MQTKHLVEKLFWSKDMNKMCRLRQHMQSKDKEKLSEKIKMENEKAEDDAKIKDASLTGSLYMVENANPKQYFFMEDFRDKKNDEFAAKQMNCEPDIISWNNINLTQKEMLKRKLISFGIIFGILCFTLLVLFIFSVAFLNSFDHSSPFFDDNVACPNTVTIQ